MTGNRSSTCVRILEIAELLIDCEEDRTLRAGLDAAATSGSALAVRMTWNLLRERLTR
jgi:hypothetical protein